MTTIFFRSLFLVIVLSFTTTYAQAQTTLFAESFDNCSIPNSWTNQAQVGNTNWEIGNCLALRKTNGTCVAFLNDLTNGSAMQSLLVSSSFDATSVSQLNLEIDFHFFHKNDASASLVIYSNGQQILLENFSKDNCQANQLNSKHLTVDISKYISADMRLGFVYNNTGQESGWIAIDNIVVSGSNDASSTTVQPLLNSFN